MRNPMLPVREAVVNIPRAATMLQCGVNDGYERAGTGLDVLSVTSLFCDVTRRIEADHGPSCE